MATFTFFARGEPKGQPRARAARFGKHVRMYDPGTAASWKEAVKHECVACIREPLTGPLSVAIALYFPRPKSHFGAGKNAARIKDSAPRFHTAKPDADNAAKAVLDAMTDCGAWRDDSQVALLTVAKHYSVGAHGAEITVRELLD